MKTVFLTHYDLDAAGAYIIAKHAWDLVYFKCQGYPKVDKAIEYLIDHYAGLDIVIADLCLAPEQVELCCKNFNSVRYFDHHQESEDIELMVASSLWDSTNLEVIYHPNLCSTALVYKYWVERYGGRPTKALSHFAQVVEVYDNWRTENPLWNESYGMNELFWKDGFFDFVKIFKDGFEEFQEEEQIYIDQKKAGKITQIENAPKDFTESGSCVILFEDAGALNDVTLQLEPNNYFMIYKIKPEMPFAMSVRSNVEDRQVNIGKAMEAVRDDFEFVTKGGGHEYAGGSSFKDGTSVKQIMEYIEAVDRNL